MDRPEAELICTIYNINYGKNKELLEKCSFLREYMIFIDYVREFYRDNDYDDLGDCIERAIDRCIEENALREFLIKHRSEVVKVTKLDYTFDRQITLERIESREEGREEGRAEGREEGLTEGEKKGEIRKTIQIICKKVGKQKSLEQTAMEMEEDPEDIRLLYDIIRSCAPDCDENQIYQTYIEKTQEKAQ